MFDFYLYLDKQVVNVLLIQLNHHQMKIHQVHFQFYDYLIYHYYQFLYYHLYYLYSFDVRQDVNMALIMINHCLHQLLIIGRYLIVVVMVNLVVMSELNIVEIKNLLNFFVYLFHFLMLMLYHLKLKKFIYTRLISNIIFMKILFFLLFY